MVVNPLMLPRHAASPPSFFRPPYQATFIPEHEHASSKALCRVVADIKVQSIVATSTIAHFIGLAAFT